MSRFTTAQRYAHSRGFILEKNIQRLDGEVYRYELDDKNGMTTLCKDLHEAVWEIRFQDGYRMAGAGI